MFPAYPFRLTSACLILELASSFPSSLFPTLFALRFFKELQKYQDFFLVVAIVHGFYSVFTKLLSRSKHEI